MRCTECHHFGVKIINMMFDSNNLSEKKISKASDFKFGCS